MPKPDRNVIARLAELETVELEITKLVAGGDGLGFFDGIPIFVPRSAPGDRLRVRLTERRPDYARGEIEELLAPGPDRVEPRCRHFVDCGGCDLQHLGYEAQVRAKVEAAAETLVRIGGIRLPEDNIRVVRGDAWAYRLRTTLHRDPAEDEDSSATAPVGYRAARSHDLVAVEECPILAPELEDVVHRLPESLAGQPGRRLDLAVGDAGRISHAPTGDTAPGGPVAVRVGELEYEFDARCFFQAHRGLLGELVEAVLGEDPGDSSSKAVDLYAGVGLFTLPLAKRYDEVTAVERDRIATRYLKANARRNQLDGIEVVTQAVETWIRDLPACDRLIVDPPRAGLSPYMRNVIQRRQIPWLTYVSCHPAALARDLAGLKQYSIQEVVFLDMFPQTGHLEMVVQGRR